MSYRPDIDGLRAFAVIAVLLHHAEVPLFPGGFIGVDIFFVISGFLITSLIKSEMDEEQFSLLAFYERRVRRIFPALFLMLVSVLLVASAVLFPSDLKRYAESLIATAAFYSNFYFWDNSGYFDPDAGSNPLLHTWSLAVEEQFYLLFPPLLIALRRTRHMAPIVGVLLIASFAASVIGVRDTPLSAFYLLPFRMWELMAGALLAIIRLPEPRNRIVKEGLAALGLALVVSSTLLITPDTPFPGETALLPCIGTALLIFANADGEAAVGRLLSLKPVVFVGLISYSLYLWHWPLLVLTRYWFFRALTPLETGAVIALAVLLAALSWYYVERPFRDRKRMSPLFIARSAAAAVALALTFASIQIYGDGFPQRYSPEIVQLLGVASERDPSLARCFDPSLAQVQARELCRIGAHGGAAPNFLVWGDSHADAILPAVDAAQRENGRAGYMAGHGSCAPLIGVVISRSTGCREFNDEVLTLALERGITDIILIAQWAMYTEGVAYGDESEILLLSDGTSWTSTPGENKAIFQRALDRTVTLLARAGKRITIVADVPEIGVVVPEAIARARVSGKEPDIRPLLNDYLERQNFAFGEFERLGDSFGVEILYPHKILCGQHSCEVMRDNHPLYRDTHHLSLFGARLLVPLFRDNH